MASKVEVRTRTGVTVHTVDGKKLTVRDATVLALQDHRCDLRRLVVTGVIEGFPNRRSWTFNWRHIISYSEWDEVDASFAD